MSIAGHSPGPSGTQDRNHAAPSKHIVAVLAYDGVCTFELGIAVEVFGLPGMGADWYWVVVYSDRPGHPVTANGDVKITTLSGLGVLRRAARIIVPLAAYRFQAAETVAERAPSCTREGNPYCVDLFWRVCTRGRRSAGRTTRRRALGKRGNLGSAVTSLPRRVVRPGSIFASTTCARTMGRRLPPKSHVAW